MKNAMIEDVMYSPGNRKHTLYTGICHGRYATISHTNKCVRYLISDSIYVFESACSEAYGRIQCCKIRLHEPPSVITFDWRLYKTGKRLVFLRLLSHSRYMRDREDSAQIRKQTIRKYFHLFCAHLRASYGHALLSSVLQRKSCSTCQFQNATGMQGFLDASAL